MNDTVIKNLRNALNQGHWRSFEKYFERTWNFVFRYYPRWAGGNLAVLDIKQLKFGGKGRKQNYVITRAWEYDDDNYETEKNIQKRGVYNELLVALEHNQIERRYRIKKPIKVSIYDVAMIRGIRPEDVGYIRVVYDNLTKTNDR